MLVAREIFRRVMATAIHSSSFFGTNRIRLVVTLIITQKNSVVTKVREKCANASHALERSIIGQWTPINGTTTFIFLAQLSCGR